MPVYSLLADYPNECSRTMHLLPPPFLLLSHLQQVVTQFWTSKVLRHTILYVVK